MLENAQVGQKAIRKMRGFRAEIWNWDAEVTAVDDATVTVLVFGDIPRSMDFRIDTGMHVDNDEFGWLQLIPA